MRSGDGLLRAGRRASAAIGTTISSIAKCFRLAVQWLAGRSLLRLSLASIGRCAVLVWCVQSVVNVRVRALGVARYEMGRDLVGLDAASRLRTMSGCVLEGLLDRRLHLGRQANRDERWPDLQRIAGRLAARIAELRRENAGRPVIVAPFHYVSQYANIYVVDELRVRLGIERLSVVSGVPRDQYGDDAALIPGIQVLYTYGDDNRGGLGMRFARALRRDGVAVLFADAPPFALHRYPMETVGVSMFDRPARIHRGVFRIGAPMDCALLPFYLTFEHGRFGARIFEFVDLASGDAPQRVADLIALALTENYPASLVAGHPSMYAFSPAK